MRENMERSRFGTAARAFAVLLLLGCLALGLPPRAQAGSGSALGDWGHYVWFTPAACFNNPAGVPFTITVHVMREANVDWTRNDNNVGEHARYPEDSPLTLELKGVPGYLAPTWEQWFNPNDPRPAEARSQP